MRAASHVRTISIPLDKYLLGEVPRNFISRHVEKGSDGRPRSETVPTRDASSLFGPREPKYADGVVVEVVRCKSQLDRRRRAAAIDFAADAIDRENVRSIHD